MGQKTTRTIGTSPENCKAVLTVIRRKPGVGRMEIAEKTHLELPVVGRVIQKLKTQGEVKTTGSFRWTTYEAKHPASKTPKTTKTTKSTRRTAKAKSK